MGLGNDQAAFMSRLHEHRGIVLSVANAYCRNRASREDVVQTITAELWRAYPRYDGRVRFSTWMYRVAVNAAISFYRRELRHDRSAGDPAPEILESQSYEAADEGDDFERRTTLYRLIDGLDELGRALILLHLDGNSYAEIADVLGVSQTNVATKLSRIRQRLRRDAANDPASS